MAAPEIRLVRCPKCRNVLPELADVPVYKCGGCDVVLIAKNRKVDDVTSLSGFHETDVGNTFDFTRSMSTDTFRTADFRSVCSKLSDTLHLSRSLTTKSSHVYDERDDLDARFLAPQERVRRGNLLMSSELQQHGRKLFSISSTENRYTNDQTNDDQDQDGLFEPLSHDHLVRNGKILERRGDLSRDPIYYRRGSLDMYRQNNFSNDVFNEFKRGASSCSVRKPVMSEDNQARLLRMVRELQDHITKNRNENGRTEPVGAEWKGKHTPTYYDHEPPYQGYSGRHGQGWLSKSTRRSFSREYKESEFSKWDHSVEMYPRERRRVDKRYLRPINGGAPFVTCYSCLKPLQLPSDFLLLKRRCHQLKCGACSKVLQFSLINKIHIIQYIPPHGNPVASASSENDFERSGPVSYSDDYSFFKKSFSTDGGRVSRALSRNIHGIEEDVRKMSYNSSKSKPEKVSSDNVSLATGSPLHRLMGYSSPSAVSRAC